MKKIYLVFAAALFFACSENPKDVSRSQSLSLTFELDTVMVDAGEELIYLQRMLGASDMSMDGRWLYNFNIQDNLLEVIDLENLRLSHKIAFEREGPNGTGRVYKLQHVDDQNFLMMDYNSLSHFSKEGDRTFLVKFGDVSDGILESDEELDYDGVLDEKNKVFYSFYSKAWVQKKGIVKLNIETRSLERIPLSQFEDLDRFTVNVHNEHQMKINLTRLFISLHEDKVLISNTTENRLIVMDSVSDSITVFSFQSNLMPNFQKEITRKDVDTDAEFLEIVKSLDKEVMFGKWHYDPKSERFIRLTYQLEKEVDDKKEFQVVLTVLDKQFRQIYEGITPLKSKQLSMFIREGKFYIFENIDDELGFVVMTINEA
jgi:hypothetical protein